MEQVWVIGDEFCKTTGPSYFTTQPEKDFYSRTNFDVTCFCNGPIAQEEKLLNRLRNTLVFAINSEWYIPKIIVVLLEQDLTDYLLRREITQISDVTIWVRKLINEFRKVLSTFKDKLPSKAKKQGWPHILWILPLLHQEFKHFSFRVDVSSVLEDLVIQQSDMSALKLKQEWDEYDKSLFMGDYQKFTSKGFKTVWAAVDKTVKFCNKMVFNSDSRAGQINSNITARKQHFENKRHENLSRGSTYLDRRRDDRFHWRRDDRRDYRQLPEPPARK